MAQVLIIDDDAGVRRVLRQLLEREGFLVAEAEDGRKGVELFRQHPADLIITDILMPEMDGVETIIMLRREFPGIKVIAMSGGGRRRAEDYLPAAHRLGAHHVIEKPFEIQPLLAAIRGLVGQQANTVT